MVPKMRRFACAARTAHAPTVLSPFAMVCGRMMRSLLSPSRQHPRSFATIVVGGRARVPLANRANQTLGNTGVVTSPTCARRVLPSSVCALRRRAAFVSSISYTCIVHGAPMGAQSADGPRLRRMQIGAGAAPTRAQDVRNRLVRSCRRRNRPRRGMGPTMGSSIRRRSGSRASRRLAFPSGTVWSRIGVDSPVRRAPRRRRRCCRPSPWYAAESCVRCCRRPASIRGPSPRSWSGAAPGSRLHRASKPNPGHHRRVPRNRQMCVPVPVGAPKTQPMGTADGDHPSVRHVVPSTGPGHGAFVK